MEDGIGYTKGRFEPPPWELEAFEALARRRAEEREALADTAEPIGSTGAQPETIGAPGGPEAGETAGKIDERQVAAMLLELSNEESADSGSLRLIARIAAVVTAIVGLGILFGGLFAMRGAAGSLAGVMGSVAMGVFGSCFVAMAAWVWVGSNRMRRSR